MLYPLTELIPVAVNPGNNCLPLPKVITHTVFSVLFTLNLVARRNCVFRKMNVFSPRFVRRT